MPGHCLKLQTTHLALRRSSDPSGRSLFLNNHLPVITLMPGGRGTRLHVLLAWRALNSSCLAMCHAGSQRAARTEEGGAGGCWTSALQAYFRLGWRCLVLNRVSMSWPIGGTADAGAVDTTVEEGASVVAWGEGHAGGALILASDAPYCPAPGGLAEGALATSHGAPDTLAAWAQCRMVAARVGGVGPGSTMVSTADGHAVRGAVVGAVVADLKGKHVSSKYTCHEVRTR
jgi:hypothetical protein